MRKTAMGLAALALVCAAATAQAGSEPARPVQIGSLEPTQPVMQPPPAKIVAKTPAKHLTVTVPQAAVAPLAAAPRIAASGQAAPSTTVVATTPTLAAPVSTKIVGDAPLKIDWGARLAPLTNGSPVGELLPVSDARSLPGAPIRKSGGFGMEMPDQNSHMASLNIKGNGQGPGIFFGTHIPLQ